jgi:hypothetical protein
MWCGTGWSGLTDYQDVVVATERGEAALPEPAAALPKPARTQSPRPNRLRWRPEARRARAGTGSVLDGVVDWLKRRATSTRMRS